jgi:hypothetical protein
MAARSRDAGSTRSGRAYVQQDPPPGIERGAESAGHLRSQTLPLAQPTLHEPEHTTWQVAAVQPMLLLEPTVKLHVAPEVQLRLALLPALTVQALPPLQAPLHEFPQVPLQLPAGQANEQLATPGSQPIWLDELPPHAAIAANPNAVRIVFTGPPRQVFKSNTAPSAYGTARFTYRGPPLWLPKITACSRRWRQPGGFSSPGRSGVAPARTWASSSKRVHRLGYWHRRLGSSVECGVDPFACHGPWWTQFSKSSV